MKTLWISQNTHILFFFIFCLCQYTQAISIQLQKDAVTAPVQGSAFFAVDMKCIGMPTIRWMFSAISKQQRIAAWIPGGYVNVTKLYEGRVETHPNGSLTISHLQLQDSGYYIITVMEPSGNSKDAGVLLNVKEVLYEDIQYLVVFVIVLGALAAFLMLFIWLLNKLYHYIKAWNLKRHLPGKHTQYNKKAICLEGWQWYEKLCDLNQQGFVCQKGEWAQH